ADKEAEAGTLLYRAALNGEARRRAMFEKGKVPPPSAPTMAGSVDGETFSSITDADPRIGANLEAFVGGQYKLIPFEHLESVKIQKPTRLRDLLWIPAIIRALPEHGGADIGEVLIPVLTPMAFEDEDPKVQLGRVTNFRELDDGSAVPVGQKLWIVDDREVALLEVRELSLVKPAQA
ncbi:MAG: type VI secretion system protein ImpE, partial [Myxococcota bacterium]